MFRHSLPCSLALFFVAACGPGGLPGQDEVAGDQTDGAQTDEAETSTESSSSDTTTTTDGGTFVDDDGCFDGCDEAFLCDLVTQDCPEGDKCIPEAGAISSSWDGSACIAVTGEGKIGEACESAGIDWGADNCGADSFCWMLEPPVEGSFSGICVPFCQENGQCAEGYSCEGFGTDLAYCVPTCDPFLQDCAEGFGCTFVEVGFMCIESEPAPNGVCNQFFTCNPGSLCIDQEFLVECPGDTCCAEFCDLDQGDGPCQAIDPNYACVPFYEEGQAPPELANLGVCILPA